MTVQNVIEKAYSTTPTASTIAEWDANSNLSANNHLSSYTTTVTSASPVTLTVGSTFQQFFTGSTAQTLTMPVTSTLVLGQSWYIVNQSSATLTVQSSGSNTIIAMAANTVAVVVCILTSGTTAASWYAEYEQSSLSLPLSLTNGGTNASLTASNGGIFYSTGSAGAILSGTSTANQVLMSGASTTPAWSTATYPVTATGTGTILRADGTNWTATTTTYPNTNAINTLLYASAANVMSALATANSSVLVTDGSGVPSLSTTLPNIALGTPTSATLTNATGYTVAHLTDVAWTDISGSISVTGCSGSPTITVARAKLIGKTYFINIQVSGTSNATSFTVTGMPQTAGATMVGPVMSASNNGAAIFNGSWLISASSTTLSFTVNESLTGWTNTGTKAANVMGFYETT